MKTIEETIQEILAEHHECRWMDTSELEILLRKVATEQKAIDIEKALDIFDSFLNFLKSHNMTHEACELNRNIFRNAMEEEI